MFKIEPFEILTSFQNQISQMIYNPTRNTLLILSGNEVFNLMLEGSKTPINLPEEVNYYSVSNKLSHSQPRSDDRSSGWRFALLGSERQRIHLEFSMSFFAVNAFKTIRYV